MAHNYTNRTNQIANEKPSPFETRPLDYEGTALNWNPFSPKDDAFCLVGYDIESMRPEKPLLWQEGEGVARAMSLPLCLESVFEEEPRESTPVQGIHYHIQEVELPQAAPEYLSSGTGVPGLSGVCLMVLATCIHRLANGASPIRKLFK
jgi:hypothetical protein